MNTIRFGRQAVLALAMLMTGHAAGAAAQTYTRLDGRGDPLKAQFNRDVDKTRVLMLVAPT